MHKPLKYLGLVAMIVAVAACGSDNDDPPPVTGPDPTPTPEVETLVDVASGNDDFSTLVAALQATGLDATLDDPDASFTVFAPTDEAFAVLLEDLGVSAEELLADPDLSDILLYHLVEGSALDSNAAIDAAGSTLEMANGQSVGLSLSGDSLLVNLSTVTMTDIEADNGVIHVIDRVLTPPGERGEPDQSIAQIASGNAELETLVAALGAADLVTTLDSTEETFTVFAPTDAAFAALGQANVDALLADTEALSDLLLQHVIQGAEVNSINAFAANGTSVTTASGDDIAVSIVDGALKFGGAEVTVTDVYATNGVVHIIDTVVVGDQGLPRPADTITDLAVATDDFSILVDALVAAELDTTLADTSTDFTVFAPTNAAFEAFLAANDLTAAELLADTETLTDVLLYHVVSDTAVLLDTALGLASASESQVTMTNGDNTALSAIGTDLFVNQASVGPANIMASNGVIHQVDSVLTPPAERGEPMENLVDTAIMAGDFEVLVEALTIAGLDAALADPEANMTVFAPNDAAFEALGDAQLNALAGEPDTLETLLSQHVVAGAQINSLAAFEANGTYVESLAGTPLPIAIDEGALTVGGARVVQPDVYASNGIIHVIDSVILGDLALPEPTSVVDVAVDNGSFTTLVAALQETGLDEVLADTSRNFTVFAPTDDAFQALLDDLGITAEELLANPDLSNILLFHVVADDDLFAEDLTGLAGGSITMANDNDAALALDGENLTIEGATVIQADVEADNGVIHVIDQVILPPDNN